jgi:hypothetical protein
MAPGSFICREHFTTDKRHFCDAWDFLLIDKNSREFVSCQCFDKSQKGTERNAP